MIRFVALSCLAMVLVAGASFVSGAHFKSGPYPPEYESLPVFDEVRLVCDRKPTDWFPDLTNEQSKTFELHCSNVVESGNDPFDVPHVQKSSLLDCAIARDVFDERRDISDKNPYKIFIPADTESGEQVFCQQKIKVPSYPYFPTEAFHADIAIFMFCFMKEDEVHFHEWYSPNPEMARSVASLTCRSLEFVAIDKSLIRNFNGL